MVFVAVSGGLFKSKEHRFVNEFLSGLKRARTSAIGKGQAVKFLIDGEKRLFGIEDRHLRDIPASIQVEGDGVVDIGEGIYAVIFYPDGSSSGGEIDLSWADGRRDTFKIARTWANIVHETTGR